MFKFGFGGLFPGTNRYIFDNGRPHRVAPTHKFQGMGYPKMIRTHRKIACSTLFHLKLDISRIIWYNRYILRKEVYQMSMPPVYLTEEERATIEKFAKNGTHNSHLIVRANILLVLDRTGKKDHMRIKRTAEEHGVSRQTVYNIIEDYHNSKDITEFLSRKVRETPPIQPKVDGEVEAHIVALACSEAPEGYARWTVRLLANKAVELDFVDSISPATIHRLLKKRNISLT